ncbi:unnamed protein product [Moneuplotes crassus]|uniref:Uncharacterized protein n=1 Tax=Euplotes crassus TaxID=5936 RepID=A0AAD1X6T3_EUPCR|nr:unnamed protein product [Moneuplotes crassus]
MMITKIFRNLPIQSLIKTLRRSLSQCAKLINPQDVAVVFISLKCILKITSRLIRRTVGTKIYQSMGFIVNQSMSSRVYQPYEVNPIHSRGSKDIGKYCIIPIFDNQSEDIFFENRFDPRRHKNNKEGIPQESISKTTSGFLTSRATSDPHFNTETNFAKIKNIKKRIKMLHTSKFTGLYTSNIKSSRGSQTVKSGTRKSSHQKCVAPRQISKSQSDLRSNILLKQKYIAHLTHRNYKKKRKEYMKEFIKYSNLKSVINKCFEDLADFKAK